MTMDDRLRHAFTDLEIRVNTTINPNPQPEGARPPKPPHRFFRVAAVAAVVVLVIGLAAIVRGPDEGDVAEQPATTVTTEPIQTTTLPESTTIAEDGTADPGDGVSSTTVVAGPAPTDAADTTAATTPPVPVAPGLVTVATETGVERYLGDENLSVSMLDRPATIAFALSDSSLVYQDAADASIRVLTSAGDDTVLVEQAEGNRMQLLNVVSYRGATRVAYTVREQVEATTETLFLQSLVDATDVVRFDRVGGIETGLAAVSAGGGMLLLEHQGEGMVWYSVFDADGTEVSLPVAPTDSCGALSPGCPWLMHLLDDGSAVAAVETDGTDSAVVILDLSGVEIARAEFPAREIAAIDIAGPRIAVTTWSAIAGRPNLGTVSVVVYTAGEATAFETPLVGYATADRT